MPVIQQHGAFRPGPAASARVVCRDCANRPGPAHVRRLLAISLFPVADLAARIFPPHKDRDADCVFNVVIERDIADSVARFRTKPRRATTDQ